MAYMKVDFNSALLKIPASMEILLDDAITGAMQECRIGLIILPGQGISAVDIVTKTSLELDMYGKKCICFIPEGVNSGFNNEEHGMQYGTYIREEITQIANMWFGIDESVSWYVLSMDSLKTVDLKNFIPQTIKLDERFNDMNDSYKNNIINRHDKMMWEEFENRIITLLEGQV